MTQFAEFRWLDVEPPLGLEAGPAVVHRPDGCRGKKNLVHPFQLPDDVEACQECFPSDTSGDSELETPRRTDGGVQPFAGGITAVTPVMGDFVRYDSTLGRLDVSLGAAVAGSLALIALGAVLAGS